MNAGVQFSINSDDPAYFGNNYVLANYCAVQDAFNLTPHEWAGICRAGITGSWCDETRKMELMQRVQSTLDEWVARYDA